LFKAKDILRILKLCWGTSPKWNILLVFLEICLALLPLSSYYLLKLLIDHTIEEKTFFDERQIWLAVIYAAILFLIAIFTSIHRIVDTGFQLRLQDHISALVIKKSSELPYEYFEDSTHYNNLHFVQQESVFKPTLLAKSIRGFLSQILMLSSLSILFSTLHWAIGFVLIAISIPAGLVKYFHTKKYYEWKMTSTELQRRSTYFNRILTTIDYAKEVRLFNLGERFTSIYSSLREKLLNQNIRLVKREGLATIIVEIFEKSVIISLILYLLYRSSMGAITVGSIVMYIQAMQKGQSTVKSFISSLSGVYNHRLYVTQLFKFLDLKHRTDRKTIKTTEQPKLEQPRPNTLQITDLSFAYPNHEKLVLKNLNTSLSAGQVVAVVGENGSGKSTLIKVISGLFDASGGTISYNNQDISDIAREEWHDKVSIIFQDFVKYDFTLEENISLYQDKEGHTEYLEKAIALSNSQVIADSLTDGAKTKLGKRFGKGTEISLGQWQRIAIARSFYKNSEIIILDEPSSAIDPLSEATIFENFKQIAANKILILVTHRIYNLKSADHIIVLDKGQLIEQGNHDQLMKNESLYYKMFSKQNTQE